MIKAISAAEKAFTREGCQAGIREDGRGLTDQRELAVETDVLPHVNGSARIKIADVIDVLCSVKAEVHSLEPHMAQRGLLEVTAEFSPSCCSVKLDDRKLASIGSHLSQQLQGVLLHSLESSLVGPLVIIPGRFCWCLHISLLITRLNGGDPLDACSMAIYAALSVTKIPKLEPVTGPSGQLDDFEVVGDIDDATTFSATQVPICTTFAKVGRVFVVDASASEHACAATALAVATDKQGKCCGLFKLHGGGTFSEDELNATLHDAKRLAPSIFDLLDTGIEAQARSTMQEG